MVTHDSTPYESLSRVTNAVSFDMAASNTKQYYDADRQMKCQLSSEASALTGEVEGCHLINDEDQTKHILIPTEIFICWSLSRINS